MPSRAIVSNHDSRFLLHHAYSESILENDSANTMIIFGFVFFHLKGLKYCSYDLFTDLSVNGLSRAFQKNSSCKIFCWYGDVCGIKKLNQSNQTMHATQIRNKCSEKRLLVYFTKI